MYNSTIFNEQRDEMNSRKRCFLHLILMLFTASVAFTALPGSFVGTYNVLGQLSVVSSVETDTQTVIYSHPLLMVDASSIKRIPCPLRSWVWIWVLVLFLIYIRYALRLPRFPTIITKKVRLDE